MLHETLPRTEETRAVLDIACERLTIQQRKLYIEHYRYRKTIREIAEQMDKPEGTIRRLLHELRGDLRKILGWG